MEAEVFKNQRRRGIATAAYNLIEGHIKLKIYKESDQQSEDSKAFWKNRK